MSVLRHDPLTDLWVIIAPERGTRPFDICSQQLEKSRSAFCPFCPGHEDQTPLPEIYAILKNGGSRRDTRDVDIMKNSNWDIRVVPNKFPALQVEVIPKKEAMGLYDQIDGFGAHEIIIEGQEHIEIPYLSISQDILILKTVRDRMRDLEKNPKFRYLSLFKNKGDDAGASLLHPHWQLIGLPITPSGVARELKQCRDYYDVKDRCLICDILRQEIKSGERVVETNERFTVLAPFASRFAGELFISPVPDLHLPAEKLYCHSFLETDDDLIEALASILQRTLLRLSKKYNDLPYNVKLHTSPFWQYGRNGRGESVKQDYHWHFHIYPRVDKIAGFELDDCYINVIPPENVARILREAAI
jgi:UDPglucose--hexose-1-phosphate uridylyltransferase